MITDPKIYFDKGCDRCKRFDTPDCKVQVWRDGLAALRRSCLSFGLDEGAKWGQPVYMLDGKNVCMIGAFNDVFFVSFFNASLLNDPDRLLKKRGANTKVGHMLEFDDVAQVIAQQPAIRTFLEQAIANRKAGLKPEKTQVDIVLPDELVDALDADPEMAEAFGALTPGRQRSYCIHISGAKQTATRVARVERARPKILEGKGFNER